MEQEKPPFITAARRIEIVQIVQSQDPFQLHQFWKGLERGEELIATLPFIVKTSLFAAGSFSPVGFCSLLPVLQRHLRTAETLPSALSTLSPLDLLNLGLQIPDHGLVWLLDCVRLLKKRLLSSAYATAAGLGLQRLSERPAGSLAYQYKIAAGILRLATVDDFPLLQPLIARLLAKPVTQRLLSSYVAETAQPRSVRDSLGLVVLSEAPFARIYLMRLFIYLVDCLLAKPDLWERVSESLESLLLRTVNWQSWQLSIGILALFNDHEGLIAKALLRVLTLELTWPFMLVEHYALFCSNQLYCDFLHHRSGTSVTSYLVHGIHNSPRLLSYLYRLYDANLQGLLFSPHLLLQDPVVTAHHQALHAALIAEGGPRALILRLGALLKLSTSAGSMPT